MRTRRIAVERSSYDALRARVSSGPRRTPGYRADADSVEVVLAGCRESDWTAEVVTS